MNSSSDFLSQISLYLVSFVKYEDLVGEDGEYHQPEPSVNWQWEIPADKGKQQEF